MLVWIVRHGKAEPGSASGKDEDRALARKGERQAAWLGGEIGRRKDRPGRIVSSPIRRAIETARLINKSLAAPLVTSVSLETGKPPSAAVILMSELDEAGDGPVMLVGHNPQLEKLVGALTAGPGADAEMKTGQAVLVDVNPEQPIGTGELLVTLRMESD
jgi:phosphohistidine phosphatase